MNGALMKAQRKIMGLTQAEVASRLDITQQAYAHYESGERQPTPDMLLKLSNLLGITLDDLLRHPKYEAGPHRKEGPPPKEGHNVSVNENWAEIIKNLTDTLKLEAENTRLRIELVETKEAEARIHDAKAREISEEKQRQAEKNLTLALEEARAARIAQAPLSDDRPDEAAVSGSAV